MSLINCSECGKEVSDKAKKCIYCGKIFAEEIRCSECGNVLSETDGICPKCGFPIERKKNSRKRNKKIVLILVAVVGIIFIVCIGRMFLLNLDPVSRYTHLQSSGKVEEANEVYNEKIADDEDLVSKLSEKQNSDMDDTYKQYKSKKISYKDATEKIKIYLEYEPSKDYATTVKKKIDSLNNSRTAYSDAQKAEKEGDIGNAIQKYKVVIKEDEDYKDAQDKIESLQDLYKTQLINEAENYVQSGNFKEAIADIDKAISVLGYTDELTQLKQNYVTLREEQYAKVVVTDKSITPKNISNWIFNNYVNFVFDITNNSNKAIVGIEGSLTVNDLFGKNIIIIGCDFTGHTIQPGETYTETRLSYECNEFVDADMQFFNTEYKDLQFSYEITSIVYEDGTTVKPE